MIGALKQVEAGRKVEDVAREVGVSKHTLYAWKAKYGGMDVSQAQEAKQLRDENTKLRKLVADLSLDKEALQSVIRKNGWSSVKRELETNSERASTIRPARQPHVPRLSRLSRLQIVRRGSDPSNTETLADQIATFKGALTARQLSDLLSISAITIYKMAKSGRLPSFRVGSCVRFCSRTIARWLRDHGG
jgi:putative transposase